MRGDKYQISLITLGVIATAFFGVFFYRELFPEYKIYQNAYVALEEFRSTYTGQPPPAFKGGVSQLVLVQKKGPEEIDRCTSCHVALQFQHFSPTQLVRDVNGNIVLDENGIPKKELNPDYVFAKLDQKIAEGGEDAEKLKALKSAKVGDHVYDMAKVLQMHPLIGRETRPFENHSVNEYGCTVCHGGNGRGLTTEKAHGPVFDGEYETEDIGPVPQFTESDPVNDPRFARIFNAKPGHELLFQTTPILVGSLIQAKCMQCHESSQEALYGAVSKTESLIFKLNQKNKSIQESFSKDLDALASLIQLRLSISNKGVAKTVNELEVKEEDYHLPTQQRDKIAKEIMLLKVMVGGNDGLRPENAQPAKDVALQKIDEMISDSLGSMLLTKELLSKVDKEGVDITQILEQFIVDHATDANATGNLFVKSKSITANQQEIDQQEEPQRYLKGDIDLLTKDYQEGERLYISQACYPCHRIAGHSRGGVGPELTEMGKYYPWYIKQSIVWPQADVKNSTMPNYRLDHEELEDLVTFLLAQRGQNKATSEAAYKAKVTEWEAGKKMPWEKAVSPADMHDLDYSMTVFATQGCAACHRLKGFESNVGYKNENTNFKESEWFRRIIPENISGSDLVRQIEKYEKEIDAHIGNVRQNSLLERIDEQFPGNTESFYSNFKFAGRAKSQMEWKERVHRVLMMYVQEYGLGRVVGPRPNWSGIYRTDEWLMEHFRKPSALVARSIMPVFPFDETKFQALTYMLDVLAKKNRDENHQVWELRGFNPEAVFNLYCSQCHGDQRVGNGPVSEWIYPVPKNLRNADFMRNLTPERVRNSIHHGVKGGPMPPWGEAPEKPLTQGGPVLTEAEIDSLVDWLFSNLPGSSVVPKDVPKWKYEPEDILKELKKEGSKLSIASKGYEYIAALKPAAPAPVAEVFDVIENSPDNPDPNSYYIKRSYYTQDNLEAGKAFFDLNCAVCHGRDADGTGVRAGVMLDAKPRMLTNLEWLDTRDDMRLLRSIKFGVTGTSMQPWGDQTTALQRMQLVMYIRSLSETQDMRHKLLMALYQTFDQARIIVDNARIQTYPAITALQNQYKEIKEKQTSLSAKAKMGEASSKEAAELYEKELDLASQLKKSEQVDVQLNELKNLITKERAIYEEIGVGIMGEKSSDRLFPLFMQLIQLHGQDYNFDNEQLTYTPKQDDQEKIVEQITQILTKQIDDLEAEKKTISGRISSPKRDEQLHDIQAEIDGLKKLKDKFLSGLEEAKRLRSEQTKIVERLRTK